MLRIRGMAKETDTEFVRSVTALSESALRDLILAVTGMYLGLHIAITAIGQPGVGTRVWLVTVAVGLTSVLALFLSSKHYLAGLVIWQVGLMADIALAIYVFRRPEISFLYCLLPLTATVVAGWPAALITEGALTALVLWFSNNPAMPPMPVAYSLAVIVGGAFAVGLGWTTIRTLFTVTQWSLRSFEQAQENMEAARQHRAEVVRLLKDLDHAYYRLERTSGALANALKAADDAERFKTEFVTNVSHELRTPLNLIIGFSEMMMTAPESYNGVRLPGPYRTDLNAICRSAQHLLALVDDVLDLARIETGKIALAREQVDLPALLAEATGIVRDYIVAKKLDLRTQVAEDLPPLWIDRLRIRQVLLNLLVNAARFTEHGWIAVTAYRDGDEVVVRVTDTGQGIPPQDLPYVFDEFRSTEQPSSAWHSGTGLGVPISKRFVEMHRGRMGVESAVTQGTSFWFTLPCSFVLPTQLGPASAARARPFVPLGESERIIVVVHDDPYMAPLLQRYLDGYRVVGVASTEEGLALAAEVKALALVKDGLEAGQAQPTGTLLVDCRLPSSRQAGLALGADDLLVKPVSRLQLLAAIDRLDRTVRRVLVADDDPEVVRLFRRMLRTRIPAHDCLEAYSGEEALRLMEAEKPDLVLLDLMMPNVGGLSVLERMAGSPELADVPVIIITAKEQDRAHLRLPGPIRIWKPEGFELGETVQALQATFNALIPGWRPPGATVTGPAEAPAGSPAWADTLPHPTRAPVGAR